ncbi:hypothetical protein L7F22_027028 [Adiantum nelumboides]|nr:hypothetical protein [Adiantum nelumboides]
MILDVILDTSGLDPDKHVLMIEEPNGDDGQPARVKAFPQDSSSTAAFRSIVLESWRLDFALYGPPSPPELPTLYKRSIIHFRQLQTLLLSLPSQGLFRRLQKTRQESLVQRVTPQEASEGGGRRSEWDDDEANALKLGVRMAIGQPAADDVGICGLREPLGSAAERLAQGDRKAAMDVTETFAFSPMINALGSLNFSVEYRSNAGIFVEELEKPPTSNLTEIEMDEDYFRPAKDRFSSARHQTQGGVSARDHPKSLLSATSQRRAVVEGLPPNSSPSLPVGVGMTPPNEGNLSSPSPSPLSSPLPPGGSGAGVQQQQQTSVFTPSAAGRPVAGLSGLRRSPSVSAGVYGTSPGSGAIGPTPPSPALAAALSSTSEAAFLTHNRRGSSGTSERRLRTLSSLIGGGQPDRSSPPSPTTASTGAVSAGNVPSSSAASASRPIGARTATAAAAREFASSLRSGSYSPSSPSPLAQQLYGGSYSRLSSSPSTRGVGPVPGPGAIQAVPLSGSSSLRSVFQSYTPSQTQSQSQASLSSLSRTPPRSLTTESRPSGFSSSSLGLVGAADPSTHSSTTSDKAEGEGSEEGGRQRPTVQPQMIKRYSSSFSYRQGRAAAATTSSGEGSAGGSSVGGVAIGGASGSGGGSDGHQQQGDAPYSRSWQSRLEQRQQFVSGGSSVWPGSSFGSGPRSLEGAGAGLFSQVEASLQ